MTPAEPAARVAVEIASGERFEFGKNWRRFLSLVDEERIAGAEGSLKAMLGVETLRGRRFLDVGCGSGLFSLAARRLGAAVQSFDYDPSSIACTEDLKQRFFPDDPQWRITHGTILDPHFVGGLGEFDVVYAWGVLHHTGALIEALENVGGLVATRGLLYVAIYNDQGLRSVLWRQVKRIYCSSAVGRSAVCAIFIPYLAVGSLVADLARGRNPIGRYRASGRARGMSAVRDWFDWLGGLPFEVAKPQVVFDFFRERGFRLTRLVTCGGKSGCNEFVFMKGAPPLPTA